MKFNKKITVVSLSTLLGLGLVGSITGAVAWYQYSTRTTSSIIGTSTGNGGTLQISADGGANWKRDLITSDVSVTQGNTKFAGFQPVTFGETAMNAALPAQAYKQPVRSEADMTKWAEAAPGNDNTADYLQYTINLQALTLNGNDYERVEKPVYITDFKIQDHTANDPDISAAVRVHLAVTDGQGTRYFLISKNNLGTGMATHGSLDLDGDGILDTKGGYEWASDSTEIDYGFLTGEHSNVQTAYYLDDGVENSHASNIVATKTNGNIDANQDDKIIAYTPAKNSATETTITVTIWNEGWQKFAGDTDNSDAMWDPVKRNNAQFDVGFTFDVGDHAF